MGAAASDYLTSYADVQYGFLDAELGIDNFHLLAAKGDYHGVSIRLKKGLDPNSTRFDDDDDFAREDTPMICAARGSPLKRGRKRHLKTLDVLLHFGGNVNKWNYLEQTPLYVACEKNLPRIVHWLIAHGANVNKATKVGVSPLLCAIRNENLAIVRLLLDAGANTLDVPQNFSRLAFPTVAKELRGENSDLPSDSDDSESSDDTEADRPTSSYRLLRPLWPVAKIKVDTPERVSLPPPTVVSPPSEAELLRQAIQAQQQLQGDRRAMLMDRVKDEQLLREQREYRAKNAVDNAKRKDKKRRQREKAKYEKYIAHVEQKRVECRLAPLRPTTPAATNPRPATTTPSPSVRWEKQKGEEKKRRSHTAEGSGGRPKWVAHQLTTMHVAGDASVRGDAVMLQQCEKIQQSLTVARERRETQRKTYTAPLDRGAVRSSLPSSSPRESTALPPVTQTLRL